MTRALECRKRRLLNEARRAILRARHGDYAYGAKTRYSRFWRLMADRLRKEAEAL